VSDSAGSYSFQGVEIHSSSEYSYNLSIESTFKKSPSSIQFDGAGRTFIKDEADNYFKLEVAAYLHSICYVLLNPTIKAPDSINVLFEQRIFHKNFPDRPCSFIVTNKSWTSLCESGNWTNGFPMGWWHIFIRKWKSGVYTETKDSIYVDRGGEVRYDICWD
jgi:hypothetical protein